MTIESAFKNWKAGKAKADAIYFAALDALQEAMGHHSDACNALNETFKIEMVQL